MSEEKNEINECDYEALGDELDRIREKREKCIIMELTKIVKKSHSFMISTNNYPSIYIHGNAFEISGKHITIYTGSEHDKYKSAYLAIELIESVYDLDSDKNDL